MNKEFVQPSFEGEDGEEIPHLYDLVSGLLDWDPNTRLGGAATEVAYLKAHPFWVGESGKPPDWEIIEQRILPSPLVEYARSAQEASAERAKSRTQDDVAIATFAALMKADEESSRVDAAYERHEKGQASQDDKRLIDKDERMTVEAWHFVSQQALAQEAMHKMEEHAQRNGIR